MSPGAAQDPLDPTSVIHTAISVSFYSSGGINDLIASKAELSYGNRFTIFAGSTDDVALNAAVERIEGDRRAHNYARRFYQTTGELQRPLVTLHNTLDPIVPFQHELNYIALLTRADRVTWVLL